MIVDRGEHAMGDGDGHEHTINEGEDSGEKNELEGKNNEPSENKVEHPKHAMRYFSPPLERNASLTWRYRNGRMDRRFEINLHLFPVQ